MITLGDVLVLSVAVLLVLIFRHIDRNNRSLEKVKRLSDRIQQDLAAIAEERSRQLQDISIGVEVHQQSARRAIEQLEASAEELNAKVADIDEIGRRIDQYDLALKQLVEMTGRAEANIKGIQKESAYVDSVGRRIKDSQKRITDLEGQVPSLIEQFTAQNLSQLEAVSSKVLHQTQETAENLTTRIHAARTEAQALVQSMEERRLEHRQNIELHQKEILDQIESSFSAKQQELTETETSFRNRMNEIAEKAQNFELASFEKLMSELDALRNDGFARQREAMEDRFATLDQDLTQLGEESRKKLVDMGEESEHRLYQFEQDFESKLEETRQEGQQQISLLLDQINRDLGDRGEILKSTLAAQLGELEERVQHSHSEIDGRFSDLKLRLDEWVAKSDGYIGDLDTRYADLSRRSVELEQEHSLRIRSVEQEIARTEADVNSRFDVLKNESQRLVAEAAELVNREIDQASMANRQNLEQRFAELDGMIQDTQNAAYQQSENISQRIEQWERDFSARLEAVGDNANKNLASTSEQFQAESNSLLEKSMQAKDEIDASLRGQLDRQREELQQALNASAAEIHRIDGLNEENSRRVGEIDVTLQRSIEDLGTQLQNSHEHIRQSIEQEGAGLEQRVLADLEKRLSEYDESISYRLSRLEGVGDELEQLDQSIHQRMQQMGENVQGELSAMSDRLHREWAQDLEQARGELAELNTSVRSHQEELRELKDQSHRNMAEQLQVLEQGFFSDLKERGQSLDDKLEHWTEGFNDTLDKIRKESEEERLSLERKYVDDFSSRLESLRTGVGSRIDEVSGEFRDRESIIREDLTVLADKIAHARENVDHQVQQIAVQAKDNMDQRYGELQDLISSRYNDVTRELDTRFKTVNANVDEQVGELRSLHDAVRSDVTLWQNQMLQKLKGSQGELEQEMSAFRIRTQENIAEIREEFDAEKAGILSDGQAARDRLSEGINEASVRISELQNELQGRSEEAISRLSTDVQHFMQDMEQRKLSMTGEMDSSMREFRSFVSQTREEFEGTQRRMIDRLNDDIRGLELTIREIEKRQKGFLQQTKLFERADSLKRSLNEDISQLKGELDRLQGERKQVSELSGEFGKIKKMADETNDKMTKFISEQRRLDGIEDNYKKLITLSQTVDNQLDKVTSKHDSLQQMQLAIRNLEELQKELDQRYERLTKRKEIIDTTLEGVDRNFHSLTDLEGRIGEISRGIGQMHGDIDQMKSRLESLAINKKESDMAMRNLKNLNQMMDELEERSEQMQKAREWLARTETRLEEVAQQADERVGILGTLASQQGTALVDDQKAPSVSVRDMVIKLKHQGWKVDDIAKSCKISRGEVELILEMAHR